MLVRFWGTRGSLPVALRADVALAKIARALVAADGRRFANEEIEGGFCRLELVTVVL